MRGPSTSASGWVRGGTGSAGGELLLASGMVDAEVEACYQAVLTHAQELRARDSEQRAAVSPERLRQPQGRAAEGAVTHHEVYG